MDLTQDQECKVIKNEEVKYIIIYSENRSSGDTDYIINQK